MQTFFDNPMCWASKNQVEKREAALEMEAKEAVDEINESSLILLTTFSSNGWLNKRLSVPGATNNYRFANSPIGQEV